eukprot:GHVR01183192.1.p1 GENE.GHVR01183192.1~~GHVR01183192.1.p1  ORF type:complete len:299 (-),score=51.65 GHVR01183192.1:1525-2421(-)
MNIHDLYLELVKAAVTGIIDTNVPLDKQFSLKMDKKLFWKIMGNGCIRTMLNDTKLNNIQYCVQNVVKEEIKGDFLEAGCWRGGAIIFMKACLNVYENLNHNIGNRNIIAACRFSESLPLDGFFLRMLIIIVSRLHIFMPLTLKQYVANKILEGFPNEEFSQETISKIIKLGKNISLFQRPEVPRADKDDFIESLKRFNLYDNKIIIKSGWFKDTFPTINIKNLAILRIDCDFYDSTLYTLDMFYKKLSIGGYCIIDDYYGFIECKEAVDKFRKVNYIKDKIIKIDNIGVYWKKSCEI